MTGSRWKWIALGLVGLVLVYAWIDGGEEPLHTIVEPVDVPEIAR